MKSRVFVSYSRKDTSFVDDLFSGLQEDANFEVLIDREGIGHGEKWKERICALIAQCDTMVFVLSPDSVASEIAVWEVEQAAKLGRRIVPVLWRPVNFESVPPHLSSLNAVPFTENQIIRGLQNLISALKTDLVWVREFGRLSRKAEEWRSRNELSALLLQDPLLKEARRLLAAAPPGAPAIPNTVRDFVDASQEAETTALQSKAAQVAELQAANKLANAATHRIRRWLVVAVLGLFCASLAGAVAFVALNREQDAKVALQGELHRNELRLKLGFRMAYYATAFYKLMSECRGNELPALDIASDIQRFDHMNPPSKCGSLENNFTSALIWAGRPDRAAANLAHDEMCRFARTVSHIQSNGDIEYIEHLRAQGVMVDLPWQDVRRTFELLFELAELEGHSPTETCV